MPVLVAPINLDLATLSILAAQDAAASPSSTRTIVGVLDLYSTEVVAMLLSRDWLPVRDSFSPCWQGGTLQNRIFMAILAPSISDVKCVALALLGYAGN
jgi:hypothetical protein